MIILETCAAWLTWTQRLDSTTAVHVAETMAGVPCEILDFWPDLRDHSQTSRTRYFPGYIDMKCHERHDGPAEGRLQACPSNLCTEFGVSIH
jgi:hypothetical protein